jgi:hypothetical protein
VADRLQQKFRVPADRIGVHYEMIDPATLAKPVEAGAAEALRKKYNIPADAAIVAACGTCDLRKGADLFAPVMARLRERWRGSRPVHGRWIGKNEDRNITRILEQDARRLGVSDHITYTGELKDPHALLALSDVFCLLSREDPFPLAMLEAAALEKPLVCFAQSGGAEEFAAMGVGVAVPYLDVAAMAEACAALLADPGRSSELGRRGAECVKSRFSVEAIAPKLWNGLQEFLRAPRREAATPYRDASVADLFRTWNLAEAPERNYVRLHLERHEGFARARAKVAEGKKGEALGLLLATVRTIIDCGDRVALVEGLAEAGEEMMAIDPTKARYFLQQAESMAAGASARIEFIAARQPGVPRRVRVLAKAEVAQAVKTAA